MISRMKGEGLYCHDVPKQLLRTGHHHISINLSYMQKTMFRRHQKQY
uniref:Uncharacterized protein n=1 Tax=Arundo donax TaxID=35708 RepID=A0A0A9BND0_ARUDO